MEIWTRDELVKLVHRILRDEVLEGAGDLSPTSDLIAAGLDSLALTQLLLAIEEATGVWVDESLLTPENLRNCETLASCLYERIAAG